MVYLIDSHCHLHDREFFTAEQAEAALERAKKNNVRRIVCIGTSHQDSRAAREFAKTHQNVYWTYGIHPENAGRQLVLPETIDSGIFEPDEEAGSPRPIAIGEVGLDYHYDGYDRTAQIKLFEEMLQLAVDHELPVSFHIREAFSDFFPAVANFPKLRGVVHSFSDNKRNLRRILETTDFYVGVNGMATYSTLPTPPLERILLETDAPFLTPAPFRGIINESGYIPQIAEWLSARLGVDFEKVAQETTKNAEQLFRFPDSVLC